METASSTTTTTITTSTNQSIPYPITAKMKTTTTTPFPQQNRSIMKSRRSFSSHEPSSSSSLHSTPAQSQQLVMRRHRLETLAEVPSAAPTTIPTQSRTKLLNRPNTRQNIAAGVLEHPFIDVKETDTYNSSEGIMSLGDLPTTSLLQPNTSSGERRRSFSVIETFGPGGTKTTTTDSNLREYIKQTSKMRSVRGELNLPPEVRMKLENPRRHFSFKRVALGILSDVGSRNTRFDFFTYFHRIKK